MLYEKLKDFQLYITAYTEREMQDPQAILQVDGNAMSGKVSSKSGTGKAAADW